MLRRCKILCYRYVSAQRKYRSVVIPDKGFALTYLDFRQFEPVVLAGLSEDKALIDAYNSEDLYVALAGALFGTNAPPTARDLCKRMFLGFCYGMSEEHIARVVAGPRASDKDRAEMLDRVLAFFARFECLGEFKRTTEQKLLTDGYIETSFGNRRYRSSDGKLKPVERRWAISQVIQGTASLIFKEAVEELAHQFEKSSILLPMHDAVLMQFEVGTVDERSSQASEIMQAAFSKRFPQVVPKVSIESFAAEDPNIAAKSG